MARIAPQQAYAVLGVQPKDDFATIRRAWTNLVKEHHPDAMTGDTRDTTARLTEINEAYDALRRHRPQKQRIHAQERRRVAQANKAQREAGLRARRFELFRKHGASEQGQTGSPQIDPRACSDKKQPAAAATKVVPQITFTDDATAPEHPARQKYLHVRTICQRADKSVMAVSV